MPAISLQTVLIAIVAALITAIGSIIVAFISTRKHPSDVSSSLMNEALDLVESLRAERTELRNELASLRTEIVKCREEIAELREENQKLRMALMAYGGTVDEEKPKEHKEPVEVEKPVKQEIPPATRLVRHQRIPRRHR